MAESKKPKSRSSPPGSLPQYLAWFIRLRWIAAAAVVCAATVDYTWLPWQDAHVPMLAMAGIVAAYNVLLWWTLRRITKAPDNRVALLALAWAQLLLDFAVLANLTVVTGGMLSPVRGFFVFHMVIASLLLPRILAYAGAAMAIVLLWTCLWATSSAPVSGEPISAFVGWGLMLLGTVWLANGLTRRLRAHRRKLIRQNKRIRKMARTLRRQQRAMVQQEKMAAAGRMAAGIAHEIANPLASMDSLLQLMERKPERVTPEGLATLREQNRRITGIVRRMTTFAHPGDGLWKDASVNEVVTKALDVLRFDQRMRRVTLEQKLEPDMPPASIIPDALEQVIINIVVNALDALADVESPRLVVQTSRENPSCSITISDNGHGIRKEHRRHLFEPFFTTKPVGKGTGLGLSISYSLVRQQRGEIHVESEPGHGAKFIIRLPLAQTPAAVTTP